MKVRAGVDSSIRENLLNMFSPEIELIRLPPEPDREFQIDFWVAPLDVKLLQRQLPYIRSLRVIQCLWAGVDALLPLVPPGVILCDGRGVHDISTSEWTVAAILAMQKYLSLYGEVQRSGDWSRRREADELYRQVHPEAAASSRPVLVDEVAGATVLIAGYGSIGAAVEARLQPFGCKFLRVARSARAGVEAADRLDDLLPQADVVVLTLPATAETRKLFNAERIAKMRRGALLVNVARGTIVDTGALANALYEGRIRAALDVTDPEPLPRDHVLWKAPNLLITPHVAGTTAMFLERGFKLASEQADRLARGEPLKNIVSGDY